MISLVLGHDGLPLYISLYNQLKTQITQGVLQAGDKLPSKRALAGQLGVSINTVDGAYGQLQSEGFLESRPKSGFYVCDIDTVVSLPKAKEVTGQKAPAEHPVLVDFSPGGVALEKFPRSVWRQMMCRSLDTGFEATPHAGDLGLRQEIAAYLLGARGVVATEEQVIVGAGSDRLLSMLSYILPSTMTLAMENLVYTKAHRHFARMGHPVFPAPMDEHGVLIEPLENQDNCVVFTTPSHHFPLGHSMPMGRRVKLLNWAGQGNRYIIEDDYDSEFRYDTKPLPSLQSIDQNERVIYMGTFSRSLSPSLRVGYMVLPPDLLERFHREYCFPCEVATLEQKALATFMAEGHFETHLNRMRVYYGKKRKWLLDALAPLENQVEILGHAAGHHVTLRSRVGLSEEVLCRKAREAGAVAYPISPYFMEGEPVANTVILGFGGLSQEEICQGGELLVEAWKK